MSMASIGNAKRFTCTANPLVSSIGPVWNEKDYAIEVEKEGYKFFPQEDGFNFKVVKLSQLKISFLDSQTKKPLPEVLVSLSGANDYRSNNIIDSSGSINYIGLVYIFKILFKILELLHNKEGPLT